MNVDEEKILDEKISDILQEDIYIPESFTNTILQVQYQKRKKTFYLNKVAILILAIILTVGINGVLAYQYFIQKKDSIPKDRFKDDIETQFNTVNELTKYKAILDYKEYKKYKSKFYEIVDMKEEDFYDNFLLILVSEWKTPNITINDISADEKNLYVEIDTSTKNINIDDYYIVSAIVKRDLYRENILIHEKNYSNSKKYEKIESLPKDYKIDIAKKDHCFVICENKALDDTEEILNEFIRNTQNGIDDYIRIYIYSEKMLGKEGKNPNYTVFDIEYKNNEYIVQCNQNNMSDEREIIYIGKFKYLDLSENGQYQMLKVWNFENDNFVIALFM